LNLVDAIKSGRPFRQKGHHEWMRRQDCANGFEFCDAAATVTLGPDDVVADYEIQEPTVTITRAQLFTAFGGLSLGDAKEEIARRLGLEP
jgi:hypothetical protein